MRGATKNRPKNAELTPLALEIGRRKNVAPILSAILVSVKLDAEKTIVRMKNVPSKPLRSKTKMVANSILMTYHTLPHN